MAAAATPAIGVLLREAVPHDVVRYEHDPRVNSFGEEAVEELATRCDVAAEQVLKTLVRPRRRSPSGSVEALAEVRSRGPGMAEGGHGRTR